MQPAEGGFDAAAEGGLYNLIKINRDTSEGRININNRIMLSAAASMRTLPVSGCMSNDTQEEISSIFYKKIIIFNFFNPYGLGGGYASEG